MDDPHDNIAEDTELFYDLDISTMQNVKGDLPISPGTNVELKDRLDAKMGFDRYTEGPARLGWLVNMQETLVEDPFWEGGRSAVDFYFIQEDGQTFKATLSQSPYFLIACKTRTEPDVEEYLRRKFDKTIERISRIQKEDLDLNNHLLGVKRTFVQIFFRNTEDMTEVRRSLMPVINSNKKAHEKEHIYLNTMSAQQDSDAENPSKGYREALEYIIDIREYDIPYIARVAIDNDYRVGLWYSVNESNGQIEIAQQFDRILPADPVVLAFDIETTKLPLKFPDAATDQIMMISYMIDRQGFLITNRDIVSADIEDFDYSPKPGEYDGPFAIFNEPDEQALLNRFFDHIIAVKPAVFVTYNGDFFDWPFIENRAKYYNIDMYERIGWYKNQLGDYCSAYGSHMDCFRWVKRDSYLPVGSQGLKAVTKYKLGYDPKELDPELMTPYAATNPHVLADYSVSDAVATYYLYMKYVHPFIFSLCNIIPLAPDDVLRKGSGTLCEMLLMVEAFKANVIMPNKHKQEKGKFYHGHYLESETYVGGHVEALESGVFRSDLPTHFRIDVDQVETLINDVERALKFSIEVEEKKSLDDIENFEEIKSDIVSKLEGLKQRPVRTEEPLIYHLDVAAMYPNIILTNRLQPPALVSEETCALCDFNRPDSNCQRKMKWSWRGEFFAADRSEYNMIKNQLEAELFPSKLPNGDLRKWTELNQSEQDTLLHKRLSDYSRKVYRRIRDSKVEEKESIVCQKENSFYVDTVRNFRDRRYEYKGKLKSWKKKVDEAMSINDITQTEEAKKMVVLMDSLQLAHKCILNSFYGYVMRKGSRWYSMEMAGIVCSTGSKIIQMARQLVERIGRPLELDTDGIWCILPKSFPENFKFKLKSGKEIPFSYPCIMLNHLVHDRFTNDQYQVLVDPDNFTYETRSENSIFFEVDGPYKAMILPASKEENKLLKKRYAVFNENGTLAELKGFEVKRRGELKIIKIFQEEVFKLFLEGSTLEECYKAVAVVANRWLDMLFSKGKTVSDEELMEYISENRSMSKKLEDYGKQKSTSISTAKRLAELLGDQMVKDAGLACQFIIAAKPLDAPVAERAIPVAVFSTETSVRNHFLRKWLKDNSITDFDIRSILDWKYYIERLGSTIQKLVTIPAAMQHISNPVPKLPHPDWLLKRPINSSTDARQRKITDMFQYKSDMPNTIELSSLHEIDMEDGVSTPVKMSNSLQASNDDEKNDANDEENIVIPNPSEDYCGWLKHQQTKWRQMIKNRKTKGTMSLGDKSKASVGVASYLSRVNRSLLSSFWEIIQVIETETPGKFCVWALIGKGLHSVNLNIDRTFLVNCREPDETGQCKRTGKILPRSMQPFYLYEFEVNEMVYQQNLDTYRSFAWHHDTLGVFETKIPLEYRSILKMGAVCVTNSRSASRKSLENTFSIDDFTLKQEASAEYLSGNRLKYAFLYHSQTDSRMVLAIFYFGTLKADVIVVDTKGNQAMPNLNRIYRESIEKMPEILEEDEIAEGFIYPPKFDDIVTFVNQEKKAFKALQKSISNFQSSRNGSTLILVQSLRPIQYFMSHVKILHEFPCVSITANARDNKYPALDWQKYAANRMMRSLMYIRDTYVDKLILSRYSHVPIANINDDPVIFISDLCLSRLLSERNIVSWYSSCSRPDLGGREEDDNIFESETLLDPEFSSPSFYSSVCIEYEIEDLAVNAILQSTFINELEGSDGNSGLSNSEMISMDKHLKQEVDIVDVNAPSFKAFKCLKDVVRTWAKDYHLHNSPVAKVLLKNCYRWLSNPSSRMYDPSILAHVHGLMKKLLMLLLGEFKRLGSNIVYATFNKIIVVTNKNNITNSIAYNDFILKSINSKDAFAFIGIKTKKFWNNLLWYDSCNFVGLHKLEQEEEVDDELTDEEMQITMEWAISEFLPSYLKQVFEQVVGEFINKYHDIQNAYDIVLEPSKKAKCIDECQILMREHFTRKLLDIIPTAQRTFSGMSGELDVDPESLKFPMLPGSFRKIDNAVLEFVKLICHVFSLNSDINDEVRLMRRQLLQLLGVREFSSEAEFSNPCESFLIHNVMCTYCQYCRDIDLAFDYQVKKNHPHLSFTDPWRCPQCLHDYDLAMIEDVLVHMIHQSIMAYQIQDLNCIKCKMVKRENMRTCCKTCASQYELSGDRMTTVVDTMMSGNSRYSPLAVITRENLERKFGVLKNIADIYEMQYLKEVLSWPLLS